LPLISASVLTEEDVVLQNYPNFSDIFNMLEIVGFLGGKYILQDGDTVINNQNIDKTTLSCSQVKNIRASIFLLGPLLSKYRFATFTYPGGCNIGKRPIDIHLDGLKSLNCRVLEYEDRVVCDGRKMKAGEVYFKFPSVGATENIMMASVLLKGTTHIYNPAKEPEIVDLQNMLNSMGAKVFGAGSSIITVEGVESLHGTIYKPIPDRIVAGTYAILGAITKGDVEISNVRAEHIASLLTKLDNMSCKISVNNDKIRIQSNSRLKNLSYIETAPFPGFPTDLQAPFMALSCVSSGQTHICEKLFETRFRQAEELSKMGADVSINGNTALIKGVEQLFGAEVFATDLRAGASLVLAGLTAKGTTKVGNVELIERGYENLCENLSSLGLDIKRIDEE